MTTQEQKYRSIFNKDFYPTPIEVLAQMQIDARNAVILEPSAGKGDIIDYCNNGGAKEVLFCEINSDLAEVCKNKAKFIGNDFLKLTALDISHITQIVMNPPFSEQKRHILHAWNIAPDGCEITTLCNSSMIDNWRYEGINELKQAVEMYGNVTELGNCFNESERQTSVDVSCIKLYKPISNESAGFEGFFMDAEPEMVGSDGIMQYNEVQALVNSYISAVKCYDEFEVINSKMKRLCAPVGMGHGFTFEVGYKEQAMNKADFSKALQKRSWKHIFEKMNLNKYLTSGVMKSVNNFVEQQTQVPFSVKNIYRMFEIIVGTKEESFNRAIVEVVDAFTQHTHENRYGVEGWKTNSGYMLNKKIIVDWMVEANFKKSLRFRYGSNIDKFNDLEKVLCNLTGSKYSAIKDKESGKVIIEGIDKLCSIPCADEMMTNYWYGCTFFEFKVFKKGTIHVKFKDDKVWELLNRKYAKIKGQVLPEKI